MPLTRTVVTIELLSEGPIDGEDVLAMYTPAIDGAVSGTVVSTTNETVTRERMAELLTAQGSDPDFLSDGLGDDGEDAANEAWEDERESEGRDEED